MWNDKFGSTGSPNIYNNSIPANTPRALSPAELEAAIHLTRMEVNLAQDEARDISIPSEFLKYCRIVLETRSL